MQQPQAGLEGLLPRWLFRSGIFRGYLAFLMCLNLSNLWALILLSLGRYLTGTAGWTFAMIGCVILGALPMGLIQKLREESEEDALQQLLQVFQRIQQRWGLALVFVCLCFFPSAVIWSNLVLDTSLPESVLCEVVDKSAFGEGSRSPEFFLTLDCSDLSQAIFMESPPLRHWQEIYPGQSVELMVHSGRWGLPYWVDLKLPRRE